MKVLRGQNAKTHGIPMLYYIATCQKCDFISIKHIYPSNKLINNQVEDTIDHTTEKKEYNANDNKQHKIIRLIYI